MPNIDEQVSPEHHFWLRSGKPISSLVQLADEFEHMDSEVFSHHINEERNDFHNWVRDVFHDGVLANRLLHVNTADEAATIIQKRLHEFETEKEWQPEVKVPEDFFRVKQSDKPKIELLPYEKPKPPQGMIVKKVVKVTERQSGGNTIQKKSIVRKYINPKKNLDRNELDRIKESIKERHAFHEPTFSLKDFALGFVLGVLMMAIFYGFFG